jgi:hypothetical protein
VKFFSELAQQLERFDNYGFHLHLNRILETKFIGEDGKEYVRFPFYELETPCPSAQPQ